MKLLKESTIKRYSNKQLLKHLDRLSDHFEKLNPAGTPAPLRIDYSYGKVYKYDFLNLSGYHFECSTEDRDYIISLIKRYSNHVSFFTSYQASTKNH